MYQTAGYYSMSIAVKNEKSLSNNHTEIVFHKMAMYTSNRLGLNKFKLNYCIHLSIFHFKHTLKKKNLREYGTEITNL